VQEAPMEAPVFREVETIPVKVGETAPAEETVQIPVTEQVGDKLVQALQQGETKVELQLMPENLGRVQVEITMTENGALRVVLHAEDPRTQSLLRQDAMGLQNILGRNTEQDVQVDVPRQQEAQQQNFYDGRQNDQQQQQQQQNNHANGQQQNDQDFLDQLRLGLISLVDEVS
jgi:flagellar hook-length control protein FliK